MYDINNVLYCEKKIKYKKYINYWNIKELFLLTEAVQLSSG
jgi:hypothetical protein